MSDMNLRMKVATAAKLAGVPVRSLFRAVKARRVPSTTENGVAMVMLADVRKWNATRNASADDDPDPDTMEAPWMPLPVAVTVTTALAALSLRRPWHRLWWKR